MRLHCGDRNADLGGDLRADMALPAQSLDRRAGGGRGLAWRGMRPGATVHQTRRPLGLKTVHPFGDGLGRRVELARGDGLRQAPFYYAARHRLSTFRRKRRILVRVHSVLPAKSLTFGDISVHASNRMDNLLKDHT